MKHIVYVVTQSEWGGAQRYVHDLAIHLPKDRFRVSVIVGNGTGELTRRLEKEGISVRTLPSLQRAIHPRDDLRALFALTEALRALRPDIVHLNSTKVGVLGALAVRRIHVPRVFFTIHGLASEEEHMFGVQQVYRRAERFAFRRMDTIIAVSEYDRAIVAARHAVSAERLVHIYHGIDIDALRILPRDRARQALWQQGVLIDPETRLVGTIANLYQTKNILTLLHAARIVHAQLPHVRFVVIGEGEERRRLEKERAQLHLERTVFFPGTIPYAGNLWEAFDAAVLPSTKEGLPYTLIEAAVAGVPIVASRVGGIPEIVGGDGILVDPKDVDALAQGIGDVLQQSVWQERAEEAQKRIRRDFTLERMLRETIALYE